MSEQTKDELLADILVALKDTLMSDLESVTYEKLKELVIRIETEVSKVR